jgi:hypothetical protein
MLDKYLLPNKNLKFIEKKTGTYYAFKSPENKNYLIDDESFGRQFTGPSISKEFCPQSLIENDIFTISNKDFSGVLQYKKKVVGEYYLMSTGNTNVLISGLDVDCLSVDEMAKFISK